MQLDFIPAGQSCQPWALGVSIVRSDGAVPLVLPVPAHTLAITTVVLQGCLWRTSAADQPEPMPRVFSTGSATRAQRYQAQGPLVCASLLCMANVLPLLTACRADQCVNCLVAPDALGVAMDVALSAEDSNAEIAHGLLNPLKARLAQCVVTQPARLFLDALQHWDGQSPAPEGWHERRWQRACKMQLGVTPKLVQRLVRLHRSARQSLAPGAPHDPLFRWSDHALDAGYCDQAHLLKDYRELAGVAPQRDASAQGGSRLRVLQLGAADLAPRVVGGTDVPTMSEISKTGGDLRLDNGAP